MGRPRKNPDKLPTRQRLLNAATEEFALSGYNARLSDVAKRAGITRASVFHHFPSKEALYQASLDAAMENLKASLLVEVQPGRPFAEAVRPIVRVLRTFAAEQRSTLRLLMRAIQAEQHDEGLPSAPLNLARIVDLITAITQDAGGTQTRDPAVVRSVIAYLVSGELMRLSMPAQDARQVFGESDGLDALIEAFFVTS